MFGSTLSAAADDPVFRMHGCGKISVRPSVDVTDRRGLAMAYTPGVARVCTAMAAADAIAALVSADAAADYVIPGQFDERVAPAVAAAVAAQARADHITRR